MSDLLIHPEVIKELQAVYIVAVTHQMRHPDQWKKRI